MINIIAIYMYTDYHLAIVEAKKVKEVRMAEERDQVEV